MNNNQERRNSQGIFYAVIGVATLVVTIVGATFAYFSATANSANNAITTGSTNISLTFEEANPNGLKSNLVPMNEALWTNANISTYVGIGADMCIDAKGNSICSVYQFTVTNPTSAAQTIFPTLTAASNGFVNLKYAVFKGPASTVALGSGLNLSTATGTAVSSNYASASGTVQNDGTLIVAGTVAPAAGASHTSSGTSDTLDNMRITLAPNNGSITYTIVLWLHETGYNQSDPDVTINTTDATSHNTNEAGKTFAAGITFTTSSGTGGVTGVLSA